MQGALNREEGAPYLIYVETQRVEFDTSHSPVLITRPIGEIDTPKIRAHNQLVREFLTTHDAPYAMVVDLRESGGLTAVQRKELVGEMKTMKIGQSLTVGTALVFDSTFMRGMLTAVMWMHKPENPVKTFATVEDAVLWCEGLLGVKQGVAFGS